MSDTEKRRIINNALFWGVFKRLVLIPAIAITLITLFYFLPKGGFFLQYRTAQAQSTFVGSQVPTRLCRTRLFMIGSVVGAATRTFYRSDSVSGDFTSFTEYSYTVHIENGDECVTVPIESSAHNLTAGYWKFHTDIVFKVGIFTKTTSYDSNVFQLFARPTNAQVEQQLRDKIAALQKQLDEITGTKGASSTGTAAPTVPQSSTSKNGVPTTSAPPDSSTHQPADPQQTITNRTLTVIQGILEPITGGLGL